MSIIICGGGLSGLSCAYELQKVGVNTSIIDFRQEIGSPTRSPGIIRDNKFWNNWCNEFELYPQCNYQINQNGDGGIRREWLEKNLAIELGKNGTNIFTKRKIDSLSSNNGEIKVITNVKSKRSNKTFTCDIIVDALGNKSKNKMWPCNSNIILDQIPNYFQTVINIPKHKKLVNWTGGITSDIPTKNNLKNNKENIVFERGDGFFECWSKENILPNTNWLEVIRGEHPISCLDFSVDLSIKKGIKLAKLTKEKINYQN